MRGDEQVMAADGRAGALEGGANLRVVTMGVDIEWKPGSKYSFGNRGQSTIFGGKNCTLTPFSISPRQETLRSSRGPCDGEWAMCIAQILDVTGILLARATPISVELAKPVAERLGSDLPRRDRQLAPYAA